ncbi:tripartite tricarboxylate transporter substrate binding protein [Roseomonas sp. SSH11]|uniref:Tripartite tricarboxylate transporter substrate binding protein n=1 Tax=Pararoseomonas baculiformis TaxID=2820812 RepID=A0ABS4A933_9PROT|nr:tripartite tricarboxylate transporter substrate binding protein [Pararoseomonas baculiformis]MBP0443511.1 tripartite tricarboxylate transporter substrate binding protein [Pararoseomonas baculiformis]
MLNRRNLVALAGLAGLGHAAGAQAQAEAFPNRPIRLVVPYTPGGSVDLMARAFGTRFSQVTGQPTVVENRPGASTMLATEYVARATPDGYTVLSGGTQLALMPHLGTRTPYDPDRDIVPVAVLTIVPYLLVVNPSLPVRTVKELIAYAKQRPGELNYASFGVGGAGHLAAEMFNMLTGVESVHIPYNGTAPGLNDVMGGRVAMSFCTIPPAIPAIEAGRLRPLGLTGTQHLSALPGVPTIEEAGVPGYECVSMNVMFAPSGVPADRLQRLNEAVTTALREPELRKLLEEQGFVPAEPMNPAQTKVSFDTSVAKLVQIIKKANIRT